MIKLEKNSKSEYQAQGSYTEKNGAIMKLKIKHISLHFGPGFICRDQIYILKLKLAPVVLRKKIKFDLVQEPAQGKCAILLAFVLYANHIYNIGSCYIF